MNVIDIREIDGAEQGERKLFPPCVPSSARPFFIHFSDQLKKTRPLQFFLGELAKFVADVHIERCRAEARSG